MSRESKQASLSRSTFSSFSFVRIRKFVAGVFRTAFPGSSLENSSHPRARECAKRKNKGEKSEIRLSAESSTESTGGKRSRSMLWSSSGLSAVERQAFPKHRGTRPTPGGGRQQVTTGQTYTNNSRERFYSPPPLSSFPSFHRLPLSLLLFCSFSFFTSLFLSHLRGCRPAGRPFVDDNRYIDRPRKPDVMSSTRESETYVTRIRMHRCVGAYVAERGERAAERRKRMRCLTCVVVGHGRPFIRLSCSSKVRHR